MPIAGPDRAGVGRVQPASRPAQRRQGRAPEQERGGVLNGTSKSARGTTLQETAKDRKGALNKDQQEIVSRVPTKGS